MGDFLNLLNFDSKEQTLQEERAKLKLFRHGSSVAG
jgi:hypothetical protein